MPIVEAVNAKDSRGNTPLTFAAKTGQYEMANLLLDKGADVNAQGRDYGNALQAASERGYEQIVKMLLESGAHQHQENNLASMPE